jgi:hypothetical protein
MDDNAYKAPKVFISYTWEDKAHQVWVREFATKLRYDGVDVTLDQWHAAPGGQLPEFMERAVRENEFVLIICTPRYKEKSDERLGGVGYEGDIMTGEVFAQRDRRRREKFVPILRRGEWETAAPSWLLGSFHVDLREGFSEEDYQNLLNALLGQREQAPPLGQPQKKKD